MDAEWAAVNQAKLQNVMNLNLPIRDASSFAGHWRVLSEQRAWASAVLGARITRAAFGCRQHTNTIMWEKFIEATIRHFSLKFWSRISRANRQSFYSAIYESDKVQVLVYYDANGRHELDLRIRNLGDDPRKAPAVGMTEIMLLTDWQAAEKFQSPFPSTEASLETEVQHLAELVRKHGTAFLRGDKRAFERIERLRREREKEVGGQNSPFNRLRKT